jgi:hypothetical protein
MGSDKHLPPNPFTGKFFRKYDLYSYLVHDLKVYKHEMVHILDADFLVLYSKLCTAILYVFIQLCIG